MRSLLALALTCIPLSAYCVTFDVLSSPPAQSTSKTCQSYSMAVGISLLGVPPFVIDSEETMRDSEGKMRANLLSICPECTVFNRTHWQKAISMYSSNQLKLASKEFPNQDLLYEFLYENASIKARTPLNPALEVAINNSSNAYFLSVTSINGKSYAASHIVTVLGVDSPLANTPGHKPALLILNSGDKNVPDQPFSDTQCISWPSNKKPKYIGSLTWVTDYTVNHLRLDWIEKK